MTTARRSTFMGPEWLDRLAGLLARHAHELTAALGGAPFSLRIALASAPTPSGRTAWQAVVHPDGRVLAAPGGDPDTDLTVEAHYYTAWTAFAADAGAGGGPVDLEALWLSRFRLTWRPAIPSASIRAIAAVLGTVRDALAARTAPIQLADARPPEDAAAPPRALYPAAHARTDPAKPAVVMAGSGETVTYAELAERSLRLAGRFWEAGLAPGDTVALLMPNHPSFLVVCWAAHRMGLYYVPVNHHLTAPEMRHVLADCGPKAFVAAAGSAGSPDELLDAMPDLRLAVAAGSPPAGFEPLDAVLAGGAPARPLPTETEGAAMIYSSGTTGLPKGGRPPLPGTHPAFPEPLSLAMYRLFGLDEGSRYLVPGAPLYHSAPLRFAMAVTRLGGTVVLQERFGAEAALAAIERHRITHSQWVPTMFSRMLDLPADVRGRYDLSGHSVAIHAAAPCPPGVKERMAAWWGPILDEYYGASEGGGISRLAPEEWSAHRGSVGRAVLGTFHILDESGAELPPGEIGTIYSAGGVPVEYHGDPAKTAAAHDALGRVTVGDVGRLDGAGFLHLTDRKDDVIISGGVNIYPQETEDALLEHPDVLDAAVIGVPNAEFGQEVKAVVRPVRPELGGDPEFAERLIRYCRDHLAHYKCPRSVDFVAELPRNPAGKLLRRRLRDGYWAGHDTHLV